MSVAESFIKKVESLTPEQQEEVMELVNQLASANEIKRPRRSLMGMFSDLNIHITEEDIAEARKEMWGNFPREVIR
jgi:hypothetical protein